MLNNVLGLSDEVKSYYSRTLMDRLVPALQHADTYGINKPHVDALPVEPDEMTLAVMKWQQFFDGDRDNNAQAHDDGYFHAIITPW